MYNLDVETIQWLSPSVCIARVTGTQVVMFGTFHPVNGFNALVTMAGKETLKGLISFLEGSIDKLYGLELDGIFGDQIDEILHGVDDYDIRDRPFGW